MREEEHTLKKELTFPNIKSISDPQPKLTPTPEKTEGPVKELNPAPTAETLEPVTKSNKAEENTKSKVKEKVVDHNS